MTELATTRASSGSTETHRADALAVRDAADIIESVVIQGDLKQLQPAQRAAYYTRVCESLKLNPLTRPFEYIVLNTKLTLYAKKDCTDQLRNIHGVSITRLDKEMVGDLYVVTAYATKADGRQDSDIGAVSLAGLRGEALANAMLKSVTKAKRRVTLSICGLGWLDESEVDSIPGARPAHVDMETGEVLDELDELQTPAGTWAPGGSAERQRAADAAVLSPAPTGAASGSANRHPADNAQNRRGKLLERYGALLTRARHAGVVQDAAPWVLAPDSSEEEITRRGLELQARINALAAAGAEERLEAPAELTTPPAF